MQFALTKFPIVWEDKGKNRIAMKKICISAKEKGAECVIFPEMTLTGFTMHTEVAQIGIEEDLQFVKELSDLLQIAIVFGCVDQGKEKARNKAVCFYQGEKIAEYAKLHPFSYGRESKYYEGGYTLAQADFADCSMGLFICYDLRFPEIFRINASRQNVLCVIANWPEERVMQWKQLLIARAIENQCFVLGVNRVGEGNGLCYVPSSFAVNPYGEIIEGIDCGNYDLLTIPLMEVKKYREVFPNQKDKRMDLYKALLDSVDNNRNDEGLEREKR